MTSRTWLQQKKALHFKGSKSDPCKGKSREKCLSRADDDFNLKGLDIKEILKKIKYPLYSQKDAQGRLVMWCWHGITANVLERRSTGWRVQ